VRLTHSASLAEGMSGGPLLEGARVIGINSQVLGGGAVPANENYALPAYLLKESVFKNYGL
jgi:S1-C subfamily serine protease